MMEGNFSIMTRKVFAKYLPAQASKMAGGGKISAVKIEIGKKNNVRPEGCICEQFAYLPKFVVYTNNSDMNELSAIGRKRRK